MSEIPVKLGCPFGHRSACEEIKREGLFKRYIDRCHFWRQVTGRDETGKEVIEWECTFHWIMKGVFASSATNAGQTAALESWRNEDIKLKQQLGDRWLSHEKAKVIEGSKS